jgi:hypothetical protein
MELMHWLGCLMNDAPISTNSLSSLVILFSTLSHCILWPTTEYNGIKQKYPQSRKQDFVA